MSSERPRRDRSAAVATLLLALTATLLGPLAPARAAEPAGSTTAAAARSAAPHVIRRGVVFEVINTSEGSLGCPADRRTYRIHGTLVGPRRAVTGDDGGRLVNVLVHDSGTGGWFWSMPGTGYDYAGSLAAKGQLSLVLDRLGYGASRLGNGRSTCLGAQTVMLHEIVQRLYAGNYTFTDGAQISAPHALHVVLHGHGVGAAIAQREAADFGDVDGLVLMSWSDTSTSSADDAETNRQVGACRGSATYTSLGATAADFRRLLFADAPARIVAKAVKKRGAVPCGDATTLRALRFASGSGARGIDVPVLLQYGADDARLGAGAASRQAARYTASPSVTTRTYAGAGSALPLERSAPAVRRDVLRFLQGL